MKTTLCFFLLFLIAPLTYAQDLKLEPIKAERWSFKIKRFSYGEMRFSNPEKLEIPIRSLGDETATKHYHRFKVYNATADVCAVIMFASLGYGLVEANNEGTNWENTPAYPVFAGAVVIGLATRLIGYSQLRRSINRYNEVLGNKVNMSLINPVQGQMGLGLKVSYALTR
jgi:hypothetical protein